MFRAFLKAAHCIFIELAPLVSVFVGSTLRRGQSGGSSYRAREIYIHPEYSYTDEAMIADLAVIRTITQIQFGPVVRPIPLGTFFVPAGATTMLTGWGATGDVRRVLALVL